MRRLIVLSFVTLDGVMQAPGGPKEDTDGGFVHGGWGVPHFDERLGALMQVQRTRPRDLLLGRRIYETFAAHRPAHESEWPGINDATKRVASTTRTESLWDPTVFREGDVADAIRRLKQEDGPELQVHGSGQLVQTPFEHDLVDELWLKVSRSSWARASASSARAWCPLRSSSAARRLRRAVCSSSTSSEGGVTTGTFAT